MNVSTLDKLLLFLSSQVQLYNILLSYSGAGPQRVGSGMIRPQQMGLSSNPSPTTIPQRPAPSMPSRPAPTRPGPSPTPSAGGVLPPPLIPRYVIAHLCMYFCCQLLIFYNLRMVIIVRGCCNKTFSYCVDIGFKLIAAKHLIIVDNYCH